MNKLKRISISKMRQQQAFKFFNRVCALIAPVTPEFKIYYDELKKANEEYEKTLSFHHKSLLTEKINEYDKKRNLSWRALRTAVNSLMLVPNPGYESVIKEADLILGTYGNPSRVPNTEQTGIIKNLIDDLYTRINKDNCKDLGINSFIEELQENNNLFSEYVVRRQDERSTHIPGIARMNRKKTEKAYRNMTQSLEVLSDLESGNQDFQTFIISLNQLIEEENVIIKARQTRNKNKKTEDTQTNSETGATTEPEPNLA
ncbi:MAG: DUF6261 family protein [Tannerellaceae bacterium]|nr:DUF6261 family protein [Tannerellaceae bacterium]